MNNHRGIFLSMLAICLAIFCAFLVTQRVEASPAAPIEFTLTQPDGKTTFTVRQWGDEWNNGKETLEGYSIVQMPDGWWAYAGPQADGLLGPALVAGKPRLVGIDKPGDLTPHLRPAVQVTNPNSVQNLGFRTPALDGARAPSLTNIKTLLLLAKFTDRAETYPAASFQSLMFSTSSSSVRKYYREISYNNADVLPVAETCGTSGDGTTAWTLLPYIHPNSLGSTHNHQDVIKDVLTANDSCIDFAAFDTNGNGYIDSSELIIIVVVAGYEEAYSSAYTPSVWAMQSAFHTGAPTLDGKVVGAEDHGVYAMFGEIHRNTVDDMHQATIGVMAHEFGHTINWPDLYDTDGSSEGGVGGWSLMAFGSWNSTSLAGDSPAHADAWLKWYQGWLTPTTVTGTLNNVSIARSEDNAVAYLLRPNPGGVDWLFWSHSGTGEFFLVENRQQALYDAGLRGCGLLIWHIDESVFYDNTANADEDDPLVWLEQADGLNEMGGTGDRGDAGDPWPGSAARHDFYNGSNPNSNMYSGSGSAVAVHVDSTSCGSTMQADLTYPVSVVFAYLPTLLKFPLLTISEGFEGGVVPPSGWTRAGSNPYSWDIGSGVFSHSGSYYAHVLPDPGKGAQNEILYSPAFFTTGGTVSFYSAGNTVYCFLNDNACDLEIWVVKGSWDAGSGNDINIGTVDALWDFSFSYFPATFDFTPAVTGGQTIRIAFRYVGKAGFQAAEVLLDDIQIKYSP